MSSLVLTVVFIAKQIRAGNKKQVLDGLIESRPVRQEDAHHHHVQVQILIAIAHLASEAQPELTTIIVHEVLEEAADPAVAALALAGEAGVVVEEEGDLLFTVKY
jgi:hypothetical protein